MFGSQSKPSRIYRYGVTRIVSGEAALCAQMRAAHEYRNALVERERERRKDCDVALRVLSPQLVEADEAYEVACKTLDQARAALKDAQAKARRKVRPPDLVAAVEAARVRRRATATERKALRTALFASPAWEEKQVEIEAEDVAERKRLRSEFSMRVGWGTRGMIEASMSSARRGAPPVFRAWRGDGHLAVQFQDHAASGGDASPRFVDLVESEGHSFCRIERVAQAGGPSRVHVSLRIGTDAEKRPVWATLLATLHRMPPDDARVKWVHLLRRRIGCSEEWSVQFVLARDSWARPDLAVTMPAQRLRFCDQHRPPDAFFAAGRHDACAEASFLRRVICAQEAGWLRRSRCLRRGFVSATAQRRSDGEGWTRQIE